MKYLILGANGLIGQHFVRWCEERNIPYIGTRNSRETEGLIPFNLLDFDRIPRLLDEISPSVLIDAVGLAGGVNFCEENPGVGRKYHVDATKIMVDWCKARDVPFAFISTDYVFDGRRPPYKENDPTNPLNLYGQLKLEAEQLIQEHLKQYVIARTTNVFGWDPQTVTPNFLMHLIDTMKEKDSIKVPSFLYGNPTYVGDLVAGIMDLIQGEHWGLYHIVGPGYINRYDWAVKCLELAGIKGKTIEKMEQPPESMVPRPLKSNLDTGKFHGKSQIKMHDIEEGLQLFVKEMPQPA